jgi:hypothetical protein
VAERCKSAVLKTSANSSLTQSPKTSTQTLQPKPNTLNQAAAERYKATVMTDVAELKAWLTKKNSKVRALFVGKAGSKEQVSVYVCFFFLGGGLRMLHGRKFCSPVTHGCVSSVTHACVYDPSQTHALTNVCLLHPPTTHPYMSRLFLLPGSKILLCLLVPEAPPSLTLRSPSLSACVYKHRSPSP